MKDLFEHKELNQLVETLGKYEEIPSDVVWNRLEEKLDGYIPPQANRRNKGGFLSGGMFTLIFFSILLVMEGSMFYILRDDFRKDEEIKYSIIQPEVENIEQRDLALFKSDKNQPVQPKNDYLNKLQSIQIHSTFKAPEVTYFSEEVKAPEVQKVEISIPEEKEVIDSESAEEKMNSTATEAYKKRLATKGKKKKVRHGLRLPSLFHKPWQRGSNWDYQLGIDAGFIQRNALRLWFQGYSVGATGEIALSPYFRIQTGLSFVEVEGLAQYLVFPDSIGRSIFLRGYNIDPLTVEEAVFWRDKTRSLEIPVLAKMFLPLRKSKIDPYLALGATFRPLEIHREIIQLDLIPSGGLVAVDQTRLTSWSRPKVMFAVKGGAELKLSKRMNLQLGLGYQRESKYVSYFSLEAAIFFTGNRGFFRWRKEY